MTSVEYREALNIIIEYAQTKMLCIDERQRKLLIEFNNIMGGKDNDKDNYL